MPVLDLNSADALRVGSTPIVRLYAGSSLVWGEASAAAEVTVTHLGNSWEPGPSNLRDGPTSRTLTVTAPTDGQIVVVVHGVSLTTTGVTVDGAEATALHAPDVQSNTYLSAHIADVTAGEHTVVATLGDGPLESAMVVWHVDGAGPIPGIATGTQPTDRAVSDAGGVIYAQQTTNAATVTPDWDGDPLEVVAADDIRSGEMVWSAAGHGPGTLSHASDLGAARNYLVLTFEPPASNGLDVSYVGMNWGADTVQTVSVTTLAPAAIVAMTPAVWAIPSAVTVDGVAATELHVEQHDSATAHIGMGAHWVQSVAPGAHEVRAEFDAALYETGLAVWVVSAPPSGPPSVRTISPAVQQTEPRDVPSGGVVVWGQLAGNRTVSVPTQSVPVLTVDADLDMRTDEWVWLASGPGPVVITPTSAGVDELVVSLVFDP